MLGKDNDVFEDSPVVRVRKAPPRSKPLGTGGDPEASRQNGLKGERHVVALLRHQFPSRDGFRVEHVAKKTPGADHDISVTKGSKLIQVVEVKTRVGKLPDPVLISDRELQFRKRTRANHAIFIVYLTKGGVVHSTVCIGRQEAYRLLPRQYWLHPGLP